MSFYTDASLVMIPSGYKDQKVYCAKPVDGSADLTFSRSNDTATRVDSNGLIEKVRTNLITYSNDFSNAAWTKVGGTTLTAGQSDYLGGNNAWKWEATGASTIQLAQNPAGATIRTASIYAKAGSISTINLWVGSAVTFDLSTGTVTSGTGTITSAGNGWYKISATGVGVSHNPYFASATAGDYVLISFAQMDEGDIATDYIATTSAAVSVGPVANLPRLSYDPANPTCPSLLLEPQRTNVVAYSEQFDNAAWGKSSVSITANAATSPDGYVNADKLISTAVSGFHNIGQTIGSKLALTPYTFSFFAKAGEIGYCLPNFSGAFSGTQLTAIINLSDGSVSNVSAGLSASTQHYGNGWYRVFLTATSQNNTSAFLATINTTDASGNGNHTGDGTSGIYIWGAQVEAGAYATSYIPTLAAATTRGADSASKTGISSLIGQTEGTLFVELGEMNTAAKDDVWIELSDGTTNNRILIYNDASGFICNQIKAAGTISSLINTGIALASNQKIAITYKTNEAKVFINGVQYGGTDTSVVVPAVGNFYLSNFTASIAQSRTIKQALIFKTALSDTELATLTA